jgi:hypothetical protein
MAKYKFAYVANVKKGLYFATIIDKNNPYCLNEYILLPFGKKTEIVLDRLELTYVGWI